MTAISFWSRRVSTILRCGSARAFARQRSSINTSHYEFNVDFLSQKGIILISRFGQSGYARDAGNRRDGVRGRGKDPVCSGDARMLPGYGEYAKRRFELNGHRPARGDRFSQ